jgi:CRISPR-associated endonuclease/helicase Cas3
VSDLGIVEFVEFFRAAHGGHDPYKWQITLADRAIYGEWPREIEVPTGLGKTAAITAAVFAMAARDDSPTRVAYAVNNRMVVTSAFDQVLRLQRLLVRHSNSSNSGPSSGANPGHDQDPTGVLAEVSRRLQARAGMFGTQLCLAPLVVSRLQGGEMKDTEWRRSPTAPTVITGTIDQIGSRMLFRGYGTSERTRSLEAGLLGEDCLVLLDEPHLAVPFLETLESLSAYRNQLEASHENVCILGATLPGRSRCLMGAGAASGHERASAQLVFDASAEDPTGQVNRLIRVRKPLRTVKAPKAAIIAAYVREVQRAANMGRRRVAVMVNTVAFARGVFEALRKGLVAESSGASKHQVDGVSDEADPRPAFQFELAIGRVRPDDRRPIADRLNQWCGPDAGSAASAESPNEGNPVVVVATQTLEVGADLSFDHVISEAAPWPSLVQRAGRLHRRGLDRAGHQPAGEFVVMSLSEAGERHPAYGKASKETFDQLRAWTREGEAEIGYFGIEEAARAGRFGEQCYPAPTNAPILLDEHVETWLVTAPALSPDCDVPVAPFLHGEQTADDVRMVWRDGIADLLASRRGAAAGSAQKPFSDADLGLDALPVRPGEVIEIPVSAARAFLRGARAATAFVADDVTALEEGQDGSAAPPDGAHRPVFLIRVGDNWSRNLADLRPGSHVMVDSRAGGLLPGSGTGGSRQFLGWDPTATVKVTDLGDGVDGIGNWRVRVSRLAANEFAGPFSLEDAERDEIGRLHGLDMCTGEQRMVAGDSVADAVAERLRELIQAAFDRVVGGTEFAALRGRRCEIVSMGVDGSPLRDIVARFAIAGSTAELGGQVELKSHAERTAAFAADAVGRIAEPKWRTAAVFAALHHDDGKARPEWQQYAVGARVTTPSRVIAKSGRSPERGEKQTDRAGSGLESGWRHEALSALIVERAVAGESQEDSGLLVGQRPDMGSLCDLVAHLVGSHHGYGRPFYATHVEGRPEQVLSDARAERFRKLNAELGPWRLAHMEAVVRLADWAASSVPTEIGQLGDAREGQASPVATAGRWSVLKGTFVNDRLRPPVEVALAGLGGSNLADYCAAVGMLRALSLADPSVTLRWDSARGLDTVPVVALPDVLPSEFEQEGPAAAGVTVLERALDGLAVFARAKTAVFGSSAGGSESGIAVEDFRRMAEAARVTDLGELLARQDCSEWLSGTYCEWVRLKSKPQSVAASVAAIWTSGRGDAWGQISDAVGLRERASGTGRGATAAKELIRSVGAALTGKFGDLHSLRDPRAKLFGLDHGSSSFRAKAERDSGYYPLLAAFALYGFNGLYRPRTRWTATGARRLKDERLVEVDMWLHASAIRYATLRQIALVGPKPVWLGEGSAVKRSREIVTSGHSSFFGPASPLDARR